MKRHGKKRAPGCECTARFTCRACLKAAGPTRVVHMTKVYGPGGALAGEVPSTATSVAATKLTGVPMQFGRGPDGAWAWVPAPKPGKSLFR